MIKTPGGGLSLPPPDFITPTETSSKPCLLMIYAATVLTGHT